MMNFEKGGKHEMLSADVDERMPSFDAQRQRNWRGMKCIVICER